MKNNFQKIPLILSVIFLILFSVAFFLLYNETNDNNQKAQDSTTIYQTEANRRDEIRTLDLSLQKIESDRSLLETHFAKSSDIVPFLDTIEKLAPQVGAKAQVDSVSTQADNTNLVVGLTATGTFEQIYRFLTLLENSPYELDFLSMDIHKVAALDVTGKSAPSSAWEAVFKMQLLSFVP
jgi:Tfp pilus assembly protein PilN